MTEPDVPVATLDGPSGAGKGTIARLLAERAGWHLLDSGALYRVTALAALERKVALDDEAAVAGLARNLDVVFDTTPGGEEIIRLEGREVTRDVRREETGDAASRVAALPAVRAALVDLQRSFRRAPGLVADGRDMGTVIFPDAPAKIFLTASAMERARRRHKQLNEKGLSANLDQLSREIAERDRRDADRAASPLKPAADAVEVDTTGLPVEEVLERVVAVVSDRCPLP